MALNEIHAILKQTRYGTGSQWSDLSNGAKGVRADERVTTRDNEFCIDRFLDEMPKKRELQ